MYFGDLYQNVQTKPSTGLRRFPQGRNAFYKWIHESLADNKPYNQMATELISGATTNTYNDGAANWMLNGWITGGPDAGHHGSGRVVRVRHVSRASVTSIASCATTAAAISTS